jgi:hypothetical protein
MAKRESPTALLRRIEALKQVYGNGVPAEKIDLLRRLSARRLPRAALVRRLHEVLCFLRAYPDDPAVLGAAETMLAEFGSRGDLKRHRRELADTGIAGTATHYAFYWPTARWLVARWPERCTVDWPEFEAADRLVEMLFLMLPYAETLALDSLDLPPREWLDSLKGPDETDAAFLVRRFEAFRLEDAAREKLFDDLLVPFVVAPAPDVPNRTHARHPGSRVVYQTRPLDRARPDLRREILRPPEAVREVPVREGRALIELAREAMVTRSRDLYAFKHADPRDVRMVECGDGLQFAVMGIVPERRLLLESVYGFLTLKNGVPAGYVLASGIFGSSEVAYNVFETFRGGEAAAIYGRAMGTIRWLFGSDAFTIDPYQLGDENEEGLKSGAWWFYRKLGFRPDDPEVKRTAREELRAMKRDPSHRSDLRTLRKLVTANVFYFVRRERDDVLGRLPLGEIGLGIVRAVAGRFGSDREAAVRTASAEAARMLGLDHRRKLSAGEKLWWDRWSLLVAALPGLERWSAGERRALARVILAKGGRREADFVRLFDRHRKLRRAILKLAETAG